MIVTVWGTEAIPMSLLVVAPTAPVVQLLRIERVNANGKIVGNWST